MRFGSVCSGIEAASVAWNPLGWHAAWFAEIERFPCAVLSNHYPDVTNYGDMTTLPDRILSGEIEAPDMLCGGTPCQAFSVAGLRRSLDDDRGNLSLTFCEIADAIDSARLDRGLPAAIVFWENVPGCLSTHDNAFGCLLGQLVGSEFPLSSGADRWPSAGVATGPKRKVAWRTLDAQHFGVPQRRKRVFVVASARKDFDPTKVLFEPSRMSRAFESSEEERKDSPSRSKDCARNACVERESKQSRLFAPSSFANYTEQEKSGPLTTRTGAIAGSSQFVLDPTNRVRKLTLLESERLQGFPDGWTKIPYRGKSAEDCPDGPRYKAIGNSWCVPCVRWLGERIKKETNK